MQRIGPLSGSERPLNGADPFKGSSESDGGTDSVGPFKGPTEGPQAKP